MKMNTIMIKTALLVALSQRDPKANHFNFKGANIYRIRGGLFHVVGHHRGEAQKTIDWLDEMSARLTTDKYGRYVIA